jgi:hypothetical protein
VIATLSFAVDSSLTWSPVAAGQGRIEVSLPWSPLPMIRSLLDAALDPQAANTATDAALHLV